MIDVPLTPVLRRARILDRVQREGGASLADLVSEHAVSPVTVHRDLELLSDQGLLERVRGGARSLPDTRPPIEVGWNTRVRGATREKDAIALKARALVEDGSTIFIDASTTGMALARALELRPPTALTLVTNSPAIALGLTADSIYVIMTPGELDQHTRVLTGRWTADFLAELNVAVAFISAAGITLEHGLTTSRAALADTLNAAAECARKTIGLLDSTKFKRDSLMTARSARSLDLIITDDGLDPATAGEFREAGVNLVVAERLALADRSSVLTPRTEGSVRLRQVEQALDGRQQRPAELEVGDLARRGQERAQPRRVHERQLGEVDPDRAAVDLGQRGREHGSLTRSNSPLRRSRRSRLLLDDATSKRGGRKLPGVGLHAHGAQ